MKKMFFFFNLSFCLLLFAFCPFLIAQEGSQKETQILTQKIERPHVYMKVAVTNPSKDKVQKTEVKSYLPIEITPNDIISTDGLEVLFDKEKKCYYLYKKEVSLEPAKIKVFSIELKDIWFIPEEEIESLKNQTKFFLDKTEKKYYNDAKEISDKIFEKLENVIKTQEKAEEGSVKDKIVIYRQNQAVIKEVKEEIEKLKNLTKKVKKQ